MAKQEITPDQCDHFTGCFVGRCGAGVPYDDVQDLSRRGQMARYPCLRSLDSFTTCAGARFTPRPRPRARLGLSEKNVGREVIYERVTGGGTEKVRGLLAGWSDDRARVFISVGRSRRRRRVITAPAADCYLARRPAAADDAAGGELPLFDLREVPRESRGRRERVRDKAA